MAVVNTYKVHYHFAQGGKTSSMEYIDYVQSADSKYDTIVAVISSNSKLRPGTLVIDSVEEVGHGDGAIA